MKCGFRLRVSLQLVINLYYVPLDYSGFRFAFRVTFTAFFSPTHKATHFLYSIHSRPNRSRVHLRFRTVLCSVFSLKWSERFRKSSRNTRNACRRCRSFRGVRTDVRQDGGPNRDFITYPFLLSWPCCALPKRRGPDSE